MGYGMQRSRSGFSSLMLLLSVHAANFVSALAPAAAEPGLPAKGAFAFDPSWDDFVMPATSGRAAAPAAADARDAAAFAHDAGPFETIQPDAHQDLALLMDYVSVPYLGPHIAPHADLLLG